MYSCLGVEVDVGNVARLVLVGVKAFTFQPAGSLDGSLTTLVFEPLPVAAGAEGGGGDGLEVDHMCSFPAVDRGITPRGFVSSIIVADSEGFCKGLRRICGGWEGFSNLGLSVRSLGGHPERRAKPEVEGSLVSKGDPSTPPRCGSAQDDRSE